MKSVSTKKNWVPIWVIPLVVAMAVLTVWLRLSIVRTSYEIGQAEKKSRQMRQQREDLELKVTAQRSPRRLEALARTKFGLGTPRSEQVIHLGTRNGAQ